MRQVLNHANDVSSSISSNISLTEDDLLIQTPRNLKYKSPIVAHNDKYLRQRIYDLEHENFHLKQQNDHLTSAVLKHSFLSAVQPPTTELDRLYAQNGALLSEVTELQALVASKNEQLNLMKSELAGGQFQRVKQHYLGPEMRYKFAEKMDESELISRGCDAIFGPKFTKFGKIGKFDPETQIRAAPAKESGGIDAVLSGIDAQLKSGQWGDVERECQVEHKLELELEQDAADIRQIRAEYGPWQDEF
ncbi:hypothetical protein SS50377_20668 [Spironucleus salmonicida]|uniref:Uncharacterized protein n=1 Tax=Spironucleus salmonicida TaxID=348837 RepID=V6LXZ4_9EUKA|nr:hypothetical protein SS50377_28741 [Spironucleus salmonicida]KAH0577317.1 hypothetical protein SS50377_20668 [Spironucleus salmonicida]|eukprot:EST49517.1 Hypothetical protein SS50377_10120 [Spironucleus salmonicida]